MKILYFSSVSWDWIKQRPHFISEELSKLNDVSVDFISLDPAQFMKFRKIKAQRITQSYNTINFSVIPFALKSSIIERQNIAIIRNYFSNKKYDIGIISEPRQYPFIEHCCDKIFYDCMDNFPEFYKGKKREIKLEEERYVIPLLDGIICSSFNLKKILTERNPLPILNIKVVKNGISNVYLTQQIQPSSVKLFKPSFVYIGTIDGWFDFDCIERILKEYPEANIYLVGPLKVKLPKKLKNEKIYIVGPVPQIEVRDLCDQADLLLLPFKVNKLIESVDPVKLYEYIASGKPILSAYWEELKDYKKYGNLYFYNSIDDITHDLLINCLSSKKITPSGDFIKRNCWEGRAKDFFEIMTNQIKCEEKVHENVLT